MDLHTGQRVRHARHGPGTITAVLGVVEGPDGATATAVEVRYDSDGWPHFGRPVGANMAELEVVEEGEVKADEN